MSLIGALAALLMSVALAAPALGELLPSQCVIIYNDRSPRSRDIAQYYAAKRGIPADHLLGIALPIENTLQRATFETRVRPTVWSFLGHPVWGNNIRCLITCYEVPLRIARKRPTENQRREAGRLNPKLVSAVDDIKDLIAKISGVTEIVKPESAPPAEKGTKPAKRKIDDEIIDKLYTKYLRAQAEHANRNRRAVGRRRVQVQRESIRSVQLAEGRSGVVERLIAGRAAASQRLELNLSIIKERCTLLQQKIADGVQPGSRGAAFEEVLPLIQELDGLFGVAKAVYNRQRSLVGKQTAASFDSEMALVFWDDYERSGWQINELYHTISDSAAPGASKALGRRTLMVARLDGPSPQIVRGMIDNAIEVERTGLVGNFYIDTRGVPPGQPYYDYDENLRELARMIDQRTDIPVIIDTKPKVFQPGSCPNTALYCGWYSLEKYVDAFDFAPGAVAIHIASFEMRSLRDPQKRYWCKELLKDGVTATLGPTDEPYLQAFPLPTEFFGMLLTGKFTLVEVFSATTPFTSWRITLLGDPLYNPFKTNPQLAWESGSR